MICKTLTAKEAKSLASFIKKHPDSKIYIKSIYGLGIGERTIVYDDMNNQEEITDDDVETF